MDTDIIIPIYNAFDFTKKCIETVIEHTDLTKHTLLLINDKSTDQRILPLLNLFTTEYPSLNITIINNESNQGFVRTVNIGMQHSSRDVVLLNSDTEVTKNWLPKIQKCAYSKAAIATVTPLSNNATLASVPDFMSENTIPSDFTIEEYAGIVERCSMNLFPEIPTANGFCMYIKREAINNIGLFDEKTFGKGYGEENDFSYRCLQAGYRHLLCDNTYIYHKGTQSFSQEKTELINSHLQILKSRYPSCVENTESFVQQNPISDIQLNIRYAINSHSKKNVLIVIHDFKEAEKKNIGGTTLHVHDLITNMKEEFNFHVLYYSDDDFKYHVTSFLPFDKITSTLGAYSQYTTLNLYNDTFNRDIKILIDTLKIDLIHIHHLKHMYLDIFKVAKERSIPVIYTLHDFYSICPSVKLFNKETFLCNYANAAGCGSCIAKTFNLNINFIPLWRKEFYENLKTVKKIIVPSYSTKNIFLNTYKDLTIEVVEHGYDKINGNPNNDNPDKKKNKLYIVVPCYNEEQVLGETSKRLKIKCENLIQKGQISKDSKIVFVDDGSKDRTWKMISELHETDSLFSGVKLSRNRGHQNALLAGLTMASEHADMAISMDADLQDDINAVDQMIEKYYEGCDIVYGVRSARETDTFFKRFTAEAFYKLINKMGGEIIYNHADYRLMSNRALKGLLEFDEVNIFLRGMVPMIGYKSDIVTYERAERFAGESKYPLKKMLSFAFEGITSLSVKPIQLIFNLGILICTLSVIAIIYFLFRHFTNNTVSGWTSLITSIWFLGGLQLVAIGLIGEYIGKVYLETKSRPKFIIEKILNN